MKHNKLIPDVDYYGGDVETYIDKLELKYRKKQLRSNQSRGDNNE